MDPTMIGTTSIDALPMASPGQQGQPIQQQMQQQQQPQQAPQQAQYQQENIKLEIDHNKFQQQRDNDPAINQQNLNQFVTGIQQASAAGMTSLPARDIPQSQEALTRDQQMKPNYIPVPETTDYIREQQNNEEIIKEYARRQQKTDSLDNMYNELQIPILLAVLYFIFQLPVVRKNVFKFLPSLFSKDGNPNLSGYIINSLIFAALYFGLTKGMKYFAI
uniref:Uncharacterized protein n=1 Tax=viral metagenome TaxID=1070528 RepID=A0A6C0HG58_9ZZZZ